MSEKIDLKAYAKFVDGVTSDTSKDLNKFLERLKELENSGVNLPRFITASIGLSDEAGEFSGYAKKILFHGKPINEENILKLKGELGDILWYWISACLALNFDPYEIMKLNIEKLQDRYPGGFSVWLSENRKDEGKW